MLYLVLLSNNRLRLYKNLSVKGNVFLMPPLVVVVSIPVPCSLCVRRFFSVHFILSQHDRVLTVKELCRETAKLLLHALIKINACVCTLVKIKVCLFHTAHVTVPETQRPAKSKHFLKIKKYDDDIN